MTIAVDHFAQALGAFAWNWSSKISGPLMRARRAVAFMAQQHGKRPGREHLPGKAVD